MEKKFSKIKIYQLVGFVQGDYDERLHRIRRKPVFYLRSLVIFFLTTSVGAKIGVSCLLIDPDDRSQFFIGNWFNYLKANGTHSARFYIGLSGRWSILIEIYNVIQMSLDLFQSATISALWFSALFFRFNSLNLKREDLFLIFLRMSNEVPYEDERKSHLIGMTKKENDDYWRKEKAFCVVYNRLFNVTVVLVASIFNISIFSINFELNPLIYAAVMTVNVVHNTYYLFIFFHSILTLNVFFCSLINFFARKYGHIASQIRLLTEPKGFSNRKLKKLVQDFNAVSLELQIINQYVSQYIGTNFFVFFPIAVVVSFVSFNLENLQLGITLMLLIITAYGMIIYIPFERANKVLNKINTASKLFQTMAFHPETDLSNKKKINYISFYTRNRKFGFTCLDFTISAHHGLTIGLQIISYIMMMLKVVRVNDLK